MRLFFGCCSLCHQVVGAGWYFLAIERIDTCWRQQCRKEGSSVCSNLYLYCNGNENERLAWSSSTDTFEICKNHSLFDLGIYQDISNKNIGSAKFVNKYLYCLWFGLQQLR